MHTDLSSKTYVSACLRVACFWGRLSGSGLVTCDYALSFGLTNGCDMALQHSLLLARLTVSKQCELQQRPTLTQVRHFEHRLLRD